MLSVQIRRRWATWLAITAMLVMSLAPALSHAIAAYRGVTWLEVCRVQSPASERSGTVGNTQDVPAVAHLLEHCPYCSTHLPSLDLPPAQKAWVPSADLTDATPASPQQAALRLLAWAHPQTRAPPASV